MATQFVWQTLWENAVRKEDRLIQGNRLLMGQIATGKGYEMLEKAKRGMDQIEQRAMIE